MKILENLSNFISITPTFINNYKIATIYVFISIVYIYVFCTTLNHISFCIGLVLSIVIPTFIKYYINTVKPSHPCWYRPSRATEHKYGIVNKIGLNTHLPGFPSSHTMLITYISIYIIVELLKKPIDSKNNLYIGIHIILPLLVGWSRYYLECHNLFQITFGWIFGFILAYMHII